METFLSSHYIFSLFLVKGKHGCVETLRMSSIEAFIFLLLKENMVVWKHLKRRMYSFPPFSVKGKHGCVETQKDDNNP